MDRKHRGNWTATIEGQPPVASVGLREPHLVGPNITLTDFTVEYAGGGRSGDAGIVPPHSSMSYPPRYLGTRPSYGMFVRRATGVTLSGVGVSWTAADGRPPFILSDVDRIRFEAGAKALPSSPPTGYDIGLRGACTGVTVSADSKLVVRNLTQKNDHGR